MDITNNLCIRKQLLSGWGRYPISEGLVYRAETQSDLDNAVRHAKDNDSVLARGAGRSYGDAAANPAGLTVLTERLNRILLFDENAGVVRVESGILIKDLIDVIASRGWMLPVVPGTQYVTIGGAIAADIHGKNHYSCGSFSQHLQGFELIDGKEKRRWCSRLQDSATFWATVGGMGLTGIITEAEIALSRISSVFMKTQHMNMQSLDALIEAFEEHVIDHQYSVAWLDCSHNDISHVKSVLFLGDHALENELSANELRGFNNKLPKLTIPMEIPLVALNRMLLQIFNRAYYSMQARRKCPIEDFDQFFFPLDSVNNWNRLYGRAGLIQYQCLLPMAKSIGQADKDACSKIVKGICEILNRCVRYEQYPWLVVLKRFGKSEIHSDVNLSFPDEGYTLTLDFPRRGGLLKCLAELDAVTLQMGGRIYLAKDCCLTPQTFQQMYPQWERWQAVRSSLDPERIFRSAFSVRLGLEQ